MSHVFSELGSTREVLSSRLGRLSRAFHVRPLALAAITARFFLPVAQKTISQARPRLSVVVTQRAGGFQILFLPVESPSVIPRHAPLRRGSLSGCFPPLRAERQRLQ
ncbi:unnamed protein product [Pleuronectes platessa]|uniref:Uncharacterized protein n=1 Tax=Pleuronectes platessa TaxID=8262 RepID=A0A9N7Z6U3_PLEPL|nr:unnamed protein product [Pleuronectes platessa]